MNYSKQSIVSATKFFVSAIQDFLPKNSENSLFLSLSNTKSSRQTPINLQISSAPPSSVLIFMGCNGPGQGRNSRS